MSRRNAKPAPAPFKPSGMGGGRGKLQLKLIAERGTNGCTAMAIAVMILHHYGASLSDVPSPEQLQADWPISRATAYRWHNSLASGAVHSSKRKRAKKLNELMPNWPRPR